MVYVYIDVEGNIGKSTEPPTEQDMELIGGGELSVMRIEQDQFGNVFPELCDPELGDDLWYDVPSAQSAADDSGRPYHFVG